MGLIVAGFVLWVLGIGWAVWGVIQHHDRRPSIPNVERLGVSGSVRRAP